MRSAALLLLAFAACDDGNPVDADWFGSASWNDGKAVVSVFRGKWKRYGEWRDAEAREYLIREYLHPEELAKRDRIDDSLVPVIKANRHVAFNTGTYDYRLMRSLFFDRATGGLVKAVGSSQDGCGLTFQRWDRNRRERVFDSYWEGEGAGARNVGRKGGALFMDELPYVAARLPSGAKVTVLTPSFLDNRLGSEVAAEHVIEGDARKRMLKTSAGALVATYEYDDEGFLSAWRIEGQQEFERVVKRRLYYWEQVGRADERLLRPQ